MTNDNLFATAKQRSWEPIATHWHFEGKKFPHCITAAKERHWVMTIIAKVLQTNFHNWAIYCHKTTNYAGMSSLKMFLMTSTILKSFSSTILFVNLKCDSLFGQGCPAGAEPERKVWRRRGSKSLHHLPPQPPTPSCHFPHPPQLITKVFLLRTTFHNIEASPSSSPSFGPHWPTGSAVFPLRFIRRIRRIHRKAYVSRSSTHC